MYSPLEQFKFLKLFNFFYIISINNFIIFFGLILAVIFIFTQLISFKNQKFISSNWFVFFFTIYFLILNMLKNIVGEESEKYFPFFLMIFTTVLVSNLIGLIPYSFTVTSHLIITFYFALICFVGINYIGLKKQKQNLLCLFLPSGTSFALIPFLIIIEFISYIFRVISLAVRLFANMMAGHTLLKVIAGFAWSMMTINIFFFALHLVPLFILILLMGLEFGVSLIQAYVFGVLICLYLNDVINLH